MAYAKQILNYERELKDAGISDKQAEIHAQKFADVIESTLVTRDHLDVRLKNTENKITQCTDNLKHDLKDLRIEMYKFFIASMLSMMAVSGVMQSVFHYWK